MRVAILGAGAVGLSTAVIAGEHGHQTVLWSPSGARTALFRQGTPLSVTGARQCSLSPAVAASCAEAMAGAEVIVLAVTCEATRAIMDVMAPLLTPSQIVVLSSHSSLSSLYLAKKLSERGVSLPIVALGTTVAYSIQKSISEVHIWFVREQIDCATLPAALTSTGLALCETLFGLRFVARENVLAATLANVNGQAHLAMILCNFTRVELAEVWHPFQYATAGVSRVISALDRERLAVAAAFGVTVPDFAEFLHFTYRIPRTGIAEMFRMMFERGDDMRGPAEVETRWITQDIPFLVAPLEALAAMADIEVPVYSASVTLLCTMYERDLRLTNDILLQLRINDMTISALRRLADNGYMGSSTV